MSLHVNVSVEPADEYQVQEITYDGQEKYIQPLTMSENLTKLAHRIDFNKIGDETDPSFDRSSEVNENETKELASFQPSLWPWDSARNKLKAALTEMSVMLDVLAIARDKRFMVLDPVQQDPTESKPTASLIAKKKALASCAVIILNGAERLRTSQVEASKNRSTDFHSELMSMRQSWRLKKVKNSILGDLSYRSAGSRYPHPGTFEVTKNEIPTFPPQSPSGMPVPRLSALKVTVPPDLEGATYIHVAIQKDTDTIARGDLSIPLPPNSNIDSSWQQKLDNAQNVLFCKELFSQLAREAVQIQLPIPTVVVGNQIIATLFPSIQLSIGLCYTTTQNKKNHQDQQQVTSRKEHKPVLEHSLHQLLREVHHNLFHTPMPHPTTATLGISTKRYLAGPEAYDKYTLVESCKSETILEQIIAQSQHVVLRLRTMYMIDTLAVEIKDPQIVSHWLCINNTIKSSVKINIVSYGYELLCRTPVVIHVGTKTLKAVCRDGRVVNMSFESQELRHLLMSQVSLHQINCVQALAKLMGWKVLSFNAHCGVGPVEPVGTASSVILASPNGERIIAIRHGPQTGAHVSISSSLEEQDFYPSTLVRDRKWQNLNGNFKEVAWEKIEGKNFISKMEYLMASLTAL